MNKSVPKNQRKLLSTSSNLEIAAEDLLLNPAIRKRFHEFYQHQNFPFRDSLICYISKNPSSSKVYQKLIQTCKFFFVKNPILVVPELHADHKEKKWLILLNKINIDPKKLLAKLWITDMISIGYGPNDDKIKKYFVNSVIPKIFKSEIKMINLWNQIISLNDFKMLASNCEDIRFYGFTITNVDGSIVFLEDIIAVLPKLKCCMLMIVDPKMITSKTFQELLKIPHFSNLEYFIIGNATEVLDIENIFTYIKKNKKTKFDLEFRFQHISDEYKNRLQVIVNEIVTTQNHDYKTPMICFDGINDESFEKLKHLYQQK